MSEDWTPEEEALLRVLSTEEPPPEGLERRIAETLRMRGLLGAPRKGEAWDAGRRRWALLAAAAALAAIVFSGGYLAGRWQPQPATAPPTRQFVLLLREASVPVSPEHVKEYVAWAREGRRAGYVLGGHQLAEEGRILGVGSAAAAEFGWVGKVDGLFVIAADSLERAEEIARTCPHLRYGGAIELREAIR